MELAEIQSKMDRLFAEMIDLQERKVLEIARGVEPNLTRDDLWNSYNHDRLEKDSYFQYEDGHLAGLMAARTAASAAFKDWAEDLRRSPGDPETSDPSSA